MAEKDKIQRTLESYNDVFADIVNALLFNGTDKVNENDLTDAQTFSYYKMEGKEVHSQERDVSKFWNNGEIRLSLIGLENQTKVDKYMPLRVIGYDGAAYRAQLLEKPKKACYPIITLVLYFGTKRHWKHYRSLKDVITITSELQPFVNDYKINVFELAWLTDKQISHFKSDFREVVMFLKCQRTGEKFLGDKKKLRHAMEILDLLRVMANNDKKLVNAIEDLKSKPKKGGISMCDVIQRLIDDKAIEDVRSFYANGASVELIAKSMKMTEEQVLKIVKEQVAVKA